MFGSSSSRSAVEWNVSSLGVVEPHQSRNAISSAVDGVQVRRFGEPDHLWPRTLVRRIRIGIE